jgi:hypothetical protein
MFILVCAVHMSRNDDTKYWVYILNAYLAIVIVWMVKAIMIMG